MRSASDIVEYIPYFNYAKLPKEIQEWYDGCDWIKEKYTTKPIFVSEYHSVIFNWLKESIEPQIKSNGPLILDRYIIVIYKFELNLKGM